MYKTKITHSQKIDIVSFYRRKTDDHGTNGLEKNMNLVK